LSPQEEAAWWDAHPDYWESQQSSDEVMLPKGNGRTRPITLRLPVEMVEALKTEASRRALPYQTLIRMWLKEQLDRHTAAAG
jgi:predicted DNA binding CopG/RHH family protein